MTLDDLKTFKRSDAFHAADQSSEMWLIRAAGFESKGFKSQAENFLVYAEIAELIEIHGQMRVFQSCGKV